MGTDKKEEPSSLAKLVLAASDVSASLKRMADEPNQRCVDNSTDLLELGVKLDTALKPFQVAVRKRRPACPR